MCEPLSVGPMRPLAIRQRNAGQDDGTESSHGPNDIRP